MMLSVVTMVSGARGGHEAGPAVKRRAARIARRETAAPATMFRVPAPSVDDATLRAAMIAHPVPVHHPIVGTAEHAKRCGLSKTDPLPPRPFRMNDRAVPIDAEGRRAP